MLRGKVEGEMALLSEGSSVKGSPEDKQASVPCVRGSTLMWGAHIFCKIRAVVTILTNPPPFFRASMDHFKCCE